MLWICLCPSSWSKRFLHFFWFGRRVGEHQAQGPLDIQPDGREASPVSAAAAMLSPAHMEHKGEEKRREPRKAES